MISLKNKRSTEHISSSSNPRTFRLVSANPAFLQTFISHFALAVDHMEVQNDKVEVELTHIVFTASMTIGEVNRELQRSVLPKGCCFVEEVDETLYGNLGNTALLTYLNRQRRVRTLSSNLLAAEPVAGYKHARGS